MSSGDVDDKAEQTTGALVVRSEVPRFDKYGEYRHYLRDDFYYSCGYCTLSECEAQGLAFEIDHYEPVTARPDLANEYSNLIYSCDECNSRKSDLTPPPAARAQGYEIFRPDNHVWDDHFEPSGTRVNSLSNVGEFTKEALDLNRQSLRRLRELRERLDVCEKFVASGILSLRRFKIDQLPAAIRTSANKAISRMPAIASKAEEKIDDLLKAASRSPLVDDDDGKAERMSKRSEHLTSAKTMFPGQWRGRDHKKAREGN